jgi:filamentous hemagglutinin family protein
MDFKQFTRQALLISAAALFTHSVHAVPQGSNVITGAASGSVSTLGPDTTVTQLQDRMIIEWDSFNLSANETVFFDQQANYVALNRILDANASTIGGAIRGNGTIILINANGIVFTPTANIKVGNLIASTLNVLDSDFLDGDDQYNFFEEANKGSIINQGSLKAASIGLIGNSVTNENRIIATAGSVDMAAGNTITLDFDGDGLMQFQVTSDLQQNIGNKINAVSNEASGVIAAAQQVVLQARAAAGVFNNAVNNAGLIKATTMAQDGQVFLLGNGSGVNLAATSNIQTDNLIIDDTPPGTGNNPGNIGSTVNANSGELNLNIEIPSDVNTSLGLYNVEAPGIRLPEDQLEN